MKSFFTLVLCACTLITSAQSSQTFTANSLVSFGGAQDWTLSYPSSCVTTFTQQVTNVHFARFDMSSLPTNISVVGITMTLTRRAIVTDDRNMADAIVRLAQGTVMIGDDKADPGPTGDWPETPTGQPATYGGSSDLWGTSLSRSDLVEPTFGVGIAVGRTGGDGDPATAVIESVQLTVHYNHILPIILTSFDVSKTAENHVNIQFATSTEENVKNLYIERSSDARNFSNIFTITPRGARNQFTRYTLVDKTPMNGMNYYRLKEVDRDGNISYFDIKGISISRPGARFQAFYNGAEIKVNVSGIKGNFTLMLHDASGSTISSQSVNITGSSHQASITAPLRSGVYIVSMKGEGYSETARIFVSK